MSIINVALPSSTLLGSIIWAAHHKIEVPLEEHYILISLVPILPKACMYRCRYAYMYQRGWGMDSG